MASRVTLCGCGALGTVLANHLVRAGVGFVRVVDRDFIETHNLQRQILFDEDDVADNLPKAEAAARKLRKINSTVTIEPVVTDIDHTNIEAARLGRGPDPRRHRQLRDALPDQRRRREAEQALDLRRRDRQRRADDDHPAGPDALHAVRDRGQPAARHDPDVRDGRRARPGGGRGGVVRGGRGDQDPEREPGQAEHQAHHVRHLGLDVPRAENRRPQGQGRMPLLQAPQVRVARRRASDRTRPRSAAATPCRSPRVATSR